jgi:hypothetical protein
MKIFQQNWRMFVIVVFSLAMMRHLLAHGSDPKKIQSKTAAGEMTKTVSLKDVTSQTKQVVVFQRKDKERKYIGNLAPNSPVLQQFRAALAQGTTAKETDLNRTDYEVVLVGGGSYWLAKYDAGKRIMAVYNFASAQQKELKLVAAVKLAHLLQEILAAARPVSQPKITSRSSDGGSADIPVPPPLKTAVQESSLILLGTPVATLDDRYNPEFPNYYKVYLIGVEQYLKDTTGLDLPIVVLNHPNRSYDPFPQFGKLYLFFLVTPIMDSVIIDGKQRKVIKVFESGEYDHFPEALIENGRAAPARASYVDEDYAPWMWGTEKEVIGRVKAEMRRQQKGRGIR